MIIKGKKEIIDKLTQLKNKLLLVRERYPFLDISSELSKVQQTIENLEREKFMIALFGAFSDGKTSVLSTLIKNFNLPINPNPTTDNVQEYSYEDFIFVDTPGLFSEKTDHDEKTREFISKANVILYVCDAVNPIKESHIPFIKWLLEDLKKIESTIVILNKMDSTGTFLDNDSEYAEMCRIKSRAVKETLTNHSIKDIENIPIVCISANPYELGFEYWQNNWDEYTKLSRIELVRTYINDFISHKEKLIVNTGISVIRDVAIEILKKLNRLKEIVQIENEKMRYEVDKLSQDFDEYERLAKECYYDYKKRLIGIREELLSAINTASNGEDMAEIIEKEIGEYGYILRNKIEAQVEEILRPLNDYMVILNKNLEIAIKDTENLESPDQEITQWLIIGSKSFSNFILSFNKRELMMKLLNIKKTWFDPIYKVPFSGRGAHMVWASKWAGRLQGFASLMQKIGPMLQIASLIKEIFDRLEFDNKKKEIKNHIEEFFKELIDIEYEDFLRQFNIEFLLHRDELDEMSKLLEKNEVIIRELEHYHNEFEEIKKLEFSP